MPAPSPPPPILYRAGPNLASERVCSGLACRVRSALAIWTKAIRIWARPFPQAPFVFPQTTLKAVHQRRQGIDGQLGLWQLRWLLRKMEGGQLPEPHGVIGNNQLRRRMRQLLTHGVELLLGLAGFLRGRLPGALGPWPRPVPLAGRAGGSGP